MKNPKSDLDTLDLSEIRITYFEADEIKTTYSEAAANSITSFVVVAVKITCLEAAEIKTTFSAVKNGT